MDGKKEDLLSCLSGLKEGETQDVKVQCLINKQYEPIRICAMRKNKEDEEAGLKRILDINKRKRKKKGISPLQEGYNKYITRNPAPNYTYMGSWIPNAS